MYLYIVDKVAPLSRCVCDPAYWSKTLLAFQVKESKDLLTCFAVLSGVLLRAKTRVAVVLINWFASCTVLTWCSHARRLKEKNQCPFSFMKPCKRQSYSITNFHSTDSGRDNMGLTSSIRLVSSSCAETRWSWLALSTLAEVRLWASGSRLHGLWSWCNKLSDITSGYRQIVRKTIHKIMRSKHFFFGGPYQGAFWSHTSFSFFGTVWWYSSR